jgi:PIN domain nuclease of toxin-antitoxin system
MGSDSPLKLLLDTHIWAWSVLEPRRLGRRVKAEIARPTNELWLSPISAWEVLMLTERGRMRLDDPRKWVIDAFRGTPAREAVLNVEVAVRSRDIMAAHLDPADRFLVATALVYGLTLVTADERLIDAKPCPILVNR